MKDVRPMKRLTVPLAIAVVAVLCLAGTAAQAQLSGKGGPIDVTADQLEMVDAQHMAIWRGNVEALQDQNRLVSDVLNIYFTGRPNKGAAPSAGMGGNWGAVDHLVADGHVYFVSPQQTARGDHAVYEAAADTITLTGDVVVVQGQSVVRGDKLVIEVKTGHATVVSNEHGRNQPQRVRGVFYSAPSTGARAAGQ